MSSSVVLSTRPSFDTNTDSQATVIGPVRMYGVDCFPVSPETVSVGKMGEYAPWFMEIGLREMRDIVNEWLEKIIGKNVVVDTSFSGNGSTVSLLVNDAPASSYGNPGLWQVLPVLVAGLMAKPGSVLKLEHPDAFLSEAGQAELGNFLANVASTGAMVVVETYSMCLMNSFLIAKKNKLVNFTACMHVDNALVPVDLEEEWPEGFFDTQEKQIAILMG